MIKVLFNYFHINSITGNKIPSFWRLFNVLQHSLIKINFSIFWKSLLNFRQFVTDRCEPVLPLQRRLKRSLGGEKYFSFDSENRQKGSRKSANHVLWLGCVQILPNGVSWKTYFPKSLNYRKNHSKVNPLWRNSLPLYNTYFATNK